MAAAEMLKSGVQALNAQDQDAAKAALNQAKEASGDDPVIDYFLKLSEGRRRGEYSRAEDDQS